MVSNAKDDLPDPLTPVNTTSWRWRTERSTPFRLCVRAPRTTSIPPGPPVSAGTRSDIATRWRVPPAGQTRHGTTDLCGPPWLCYPAPVSGLHPQHFRFPVAAASSPHRNTRDLTNLRLNASMDEVRLRGRSFV